MVTSHTLGSVSELLCLTHVIVPCSTTHITLLLHSSFVRCVTSSEVAINLKSNQFYEVGSYASSGCVQVRLLAPPSAW